MAFLLAIFVDTFDMDTFDMDTFEEGRRGEELATDAASVAPPVSTETGLRHEQPHLDQSRAPRRQANAHQQKIEQIAFRARKGRAFAKERCGCSRTLRVLCLARNAKSRIQGDSQTKSGRNSCPRPGARIRSAARIDRQ